MSVITVTCHNVNNINNFEILLLLKHKHSLGTHSVFYIGLHRHITNDAINVMHSYYIIIQIIVQYMVQSIMTAILIHLNLDGHCISMAKVS